MRTLQAVFEHEGNRAIITQKWKLVAIGWQGARVLYDMVTDRTASKDLAAENPRQATLLAGMWDVWARRVNVLPRPGQAGK